MPYADREKQLAYQREYVRRKRALRRLAKLLQERERAEKVYEDPDMKYFDPNRNWLKRIDEQIKDRYETVKRCEGLLQNVTKQ